MKEIEILTRVDMPFGIDEISERYSFDEIRNRICDRLDDVENIEEAIFTVDFFLFDTTAHQCVTDKRYFCNGEKLTEAYEILGFDNIDQYLNWLKEHIA